MIYASNESYHKTFDRQIQLILIFDYEKMLELRPQIIFPDFFPGYFQNVYLECDDSNRVSVNGARKHYNK